MASSDSIHNTRVDIRLLASKNAEASRSDVLALNDLRVSLREQGISCTQAAMQTNAGYKGTQEVIVAAVTSASLATALARVVVAWLQRNRDRRVSISIVRGNNRVVIEVDINSASDASMQAIVSAALGSGSDVEEDLQLAEGDV